MGNQLGGATLPGSPVELHQTPSAHPPNVMPKGSDHRLPAAQGIQQAPLLGVLGSLLFTAGFHEGTPLLNVSSTRLSFIVQRDPIAATPTVTTPAQDPVVAQDTAPAPIYSPRPVAPTSPVCTVPTHINACTKTEDKPFSVHCSMQVNLPLQSPIELKPEPEA